MRKINLFLPVLMTILASLTLLSSAARAEDKYNDIQGVVKNESGEPVANATVRLMKRMGTDRDLHMISDTQTDRHGKFEFKKVAIGTFVVDASKGDLHAMRHVDLDDGDADLSITLRQGGGDSNVVAGKGDGYTSIDGIVRGADKQPIRNAEVRLLGRVKDSKHFKELDSVTTDKKGFFEFYKVADGTYTIEAVKGDEKIDREVTIKSGEHMDRLEMTFHHG